MYYFHNFIKQARPTFSFFFYERPQKLLAATVVRITISVIPISLNDCDIFIICTLYT